MKKLLELRAKVRGEMEHLPKGNISQNMLRQMYWCLRMNSLGKKAKVSESKRDVLKKVIRAVQKEFPDLKPQYDKTFFKF